MVLRALATCGVWLVLLLAGCASPDPPPADGGSTSATESSADAGAEPADTSAAPAPASGSSGVHDLRATYAELPDMGDTREYFRAHGQRALVDRGYFRGDLQLAGVGVRKEGAGPDETVIDGHVEVRGDGWVLSGMTITGDVTVRGENNDLSGCRVLGRVDARGAGNALPPR